MTYEKLFENFENVTTPQECEVLGDVPSWLNGTLLRNGPGMFKIGDTKYRHWFDGMAYIERYHITDGKMFYTARFLESQDYLDNMRARRIVCTSFGTKMFPDPGKNIFQRMASYFSTNRTVDNCNVSFVTTDDGIYALTESSLLLRIDIDTLDILEKMDMSDHLNTSLHTYSAHFQTDHDGTLYNIGCNYGHNSRYVITATKNPVNIEDPPNVRKLKAIRTLVAVQASDSWNPAYFHSFGMSENHLILFESPLRVSLKKMMVRTFTGWSFQNCLHWDETALVNVIILNRTHRIPMERKITSDPFFTFHHANAFERDDCLIVDYVKYDNPGNLEALLLEHMRTGAFRTNSGFTPYLHRMIIPLNVSEDRKPGDNLLSSYEFAIGYEAILQEDGSIHCNDRRLCDISIEFPRCSDDRNAREYQYVYGTCLAHEPSQKYGIVKVDVKDGNHKVWNKKNGQQLCAEPILVNKPGFTAEDEGVLIVPVVTVPEADIPYVLLLDAQNLDELCRFLIPQLRIPLGFHGLYTPRSSLPNTNNTESTESTESTEATEQPSSTSTNPNPETDQQQQSSTNNLIPETEQLFND